MWGFLCNFGTEFDLKRYMRLLGNIEAKIDAKGRAFLPAVFRKVLQASGEERLVLRKDVFQDCLVLYPESEWNKALDELRRRLSRWNARQQMVYRMFVSDAEMLPIDGNGRVLIPKRYLQMAGISQGVKFIGMGDTIELWKNDGDEQPFMSPEAFGRALEGVMDAGRLGLDGRCGPFASPGAADGGVAGSSSSAYSGGPTAPQRPDNSSAL